MDDLSLLKPLEGQLSKYTNVMKGWQFRWFSLSPETGILVYYLNESEKQRPRGSLHLAGAVISPSDEDSHTFIVYSASGEVFKLRACDARERQHWVDKLRAVAQRHTQAQNNAPQHLGRLGYSSLSVLDAFSSVRQILDQATLNQQQLAQAVEQLPSSGEAILKCNDKESLLLKATSAATVNCLNECLQILHHQQYALTASPATKTRTRQMLPQISTSRATITSALESFDERDVINSDEEDTDEEDSMLTNADGSGRELGVRVEENKSMILSLLSQLKLGMDLTRVTLPTFILEPRSLLEMFADHLAHPHIFIRMSSCGSAEERMLALVEWYLSSFHIGRRGVGSSRKPYNPLLGERFHCSWRLPTGKVRFTAEQVSHHPPVSAFHMECPQKKISLSGSIYTQSKFMGMKIGVNMIGEVRVRLESRNETYTLTLPSAYAHSVLTAPWIELGGKVTLHCNQTGYNANIIFHTKPFYGGKLHRISGEMKSASNTFVCKLQGEWNSNFEFTFANGETRFVDVTQAPVKRKRVRPLEKQSILESRKLWRNVTMALKDGDLVTATSHKKYLEERQRMEEQSRTLYAPKYFVQRSGHWFYKDPFRE